MDKKALGIGIGIGVVGTGILNLTGALVSRAIGKRYAADLAQSLIDEDDNGVDCQQEETEE